MKSTQEPLEPTNCVVTVLDNMALSFAAAQEREIVLEVEVGGRSMSTSEPLPRDTLTCRLVTRVQVAHANTGRGDERGESLEIDREQNGNLTISTAFHNRWLWLGFQLLTVACVFFSGRITLNL